MDVEIMGTHQEMSRQIRCLYEAQVVPNGCQRDVRRNQKNETRTSTSQNQRQEVQRLPRHQ